MGPSHSPDVASRAAGQHRAQPPRPAPGRDTKNRGLTNYLGRDRDVADNFFIRRGARFERVIDSTFATNNGSHGVTLVDFDQNGDLDLHLTNNHATGTNPLFENQLPADQSRGWLRRDRSRGFGRELGSTSQGRIAGRPLEIDQG